MAMTRLWKVAKSHDKAAGRLRERGETHALSRPPRGEPGAETNSLTLPQAVAPGDPMLLEKHTSTHT